LVSPNEDGRYRLLRAISIGACGLLLLAAAFAAGCSDDDDDGNGAATGAEAQVEQTIRSAVDAYRAQNLELFLSFWTDDGLEDEFGGTRAELRQAGAEFFGGPPLSLRNVSDIDVSGDEASAVAELVFGVSLAPERFELITQSGQWKINATEPVNARVPDGTTKVDVDLDEFAFKFDAAKITGGNVAFVADNVGDQPHEVVLFQVPSSFTVQQMLALAQAEDEEPPPGVEPVAFVGPVEPGDDTNLVLTQPLPAGKYMMVCFLPDEDDPQETPHAARGMISEFSVR
jgi:hypothetical protein